MSTGRRKQNHEYLTEKTKPRLQDGENKTMSTRWKKNKNNEYRTEKTDPEYMTEISSK